MPSLEREGSRDRDVVLKHQHSFSDSGRSSVPMWDSSDPDRAPPPLPLNPGSPNLTTRANTSASIAATAQALQDKARESASPYTTNPMAEKSPERSLIKGAAHRRLQSLQTGSARDLRNYFDGARSPERSPERVGRASTPTFSGKSDKDYLSSSPEKGPSRSETPTPAGRDLVKETPSLRPTTRMPPKAILGENTPPSATMLALQTMPVQDFDAPLTSITNSSTARGPQNLDAISSQLLSLTTIATNLQREMTQLSRRSKDNATDLVSLKEATNTRDEDIRKTLRELVNNASSASSNYLGAPNGMSRSSSSFGASLFDTKTLHSSPPSATKPFSLPQIPSPNLFDDRVGSPNPYSVEGAASVAMLEKIIREMVTKEGQERLLSNLSQLLEKANQESGDTAKKVTELVEFIKDSSQSQALVPRGGGPGNDPPKSAADQDGPQPGSLVRANRDVNGGSSVPSAEEAQKPYSSPKAADFVSDEIIKLLKKIKDSVTQSGGMLGEVKAQQRDLRGEVLHMGRDLGRKIDEASSLHQAVVPIEDGQGKQDVACIIQEGLSELKNHLDQVMREKRRQSSSSVRSKNSVDAREVYDVVKHALAEHGLDRAPPAHAGTQPLDKDAILDAVKEAYEAYKPEIELQQFGLERDEILQCLREGLEDYRSSGGARESSGMSREEIMDAVSEAMQHFHPPPPINEAHEIREEVLMAVKECLEDFRPVVQPLPATRDVEITRSDVLDAVKEGLATHGPGITRDMQIEISREDLFDAVKAGLEGSRTPLGGYGEQVANQLNELVQDMRNEFKSYSAANGRDTEQVLDAMKDGLESLRAEIESYVDRAQDVTGKDEIIETVRNGLEHLRLDVEGYVAIGPQGDNALSRSEMLSYIKSEFEHLHEAMGSQVAPAASADKEAILNAMHAGFESIRTHAGSRGIDDDLPEEIQEAMKEEFDQLREAILAGNASHKDEVLESLQGGFDSLHTKLDHRPIVSASNEEVLSMVKEEFAHLREALAATLVRSSGAADKDDIIDAIREQIDGLRTHLSADQDDASRKTLGAIQQELEHLRGTIASSLVRGGDSAADKDEILEAVRLGLENMRGEVTRSPEAGVNEEVLEAIRAELEHLRQSLATSVVHNNSRADTEEILETVRLGLDDLRSHLEKRLDNPERHMSVTSEILDALNDGLDGLRGDVAKVMNRPVDMSVSYEILETLKDGLASLRADMDRLKDNKRPVSSARSFAGNEVVPAEDSDGAQSHEAPATAKVPETLRRNDLERMEVMLAQLQIKVEALDDNIQHTPAPPPAPAAKPALGTAMKEDLAPIEDLLKDLQATVTVIATQDHADMSGLAKKEDTEAIETLLRNTKDKLDDIALPDPENAATKEHLDNLEAVVRMTSETLDSLAIRFDEKAATKGDVAVIQVLVDDIKTALDEAKARKSTEEETEDDTEKITRKKDLDVLGVLCMEIKQKLGDMTIPDPENIPSKADFEQLIGLIHDFRDSHNKLKDSYETDIGVTAKAFDDRKKEAEDLVVSIADIKDVLENVKDELKSKVEEGSQDVGILTATIKGLEETIGTNFNITADIKDLMETVTREFERAHGSIESVKIDQEEKATANFEKHDEVQSTIITEICQKLDERFETIVTRYDDALLAADEQARAMQEKAAEQADLLSSAKAMSDELKLTIDTLGTSITALESTFADTARKMTEDSKTVYGRMEDTIIKLDEHHTDTKAEHQLTRDEVAKALTAIDGIQGEVTEFHPKFMVTLREVLALVNQHYQHSQKAQEEAQERARVAAQESKARTEELKGSFSALPTLQPPLPSAAEPIEKYDDAQVHEKLDKLINQATESQQTVAQLDRLDQIHQQVMATAAEVSEFVAVQTKLITEDHENKEREAEEVALLLERRTAQKEQIESDIHNLNDEKESLRAVVEGLRADRDALAAQKTRLMADVSSFETALAIRREELHAMDAKADALERRILEGIMDHSRSLLLKKTSKQASTKPNNVQRASSNMSHSTISSLPPPPNAASNGLSMALKARPPLRKSNNSIPNNPASRRILSLNQITGNVPTGAQALSHAPPTLSNLKRSHSVKTQYLRKSSWSGVPDKRVTSVSVMEADKENDDGALSEVESLDENHATTHEAHEVLSDDGTERRLSYATATGTESGMTYDTGSYTESYSEGVTPGADSRLSYGTGTVSGDSDLTYGTGSYLTGSETDRRTSYGSTVRSTLGGRETVIDEEEGEEGDEHGMAREHEAPQEEVVGQEEQVGQEGEGEKKHMVVFAAPSDSGLGSDIPTAANSGSEVDYFRRAAEGD